MLGLRPDRDRPPGRLAPGTLRGTRAALAFARAEFDLDDRVRALVYGWRPTATLAPFWTNGALARPVDHEVLRGEPLPRFGLPLVIAARWPDQAHPILLLALY